ncbi:SAM-dependent methyltransferase [Nocardia sp. CNY236]|uniref:SAM-dependent methyltransferase n=1 Tax=Nocardia sp. CNY236 TaxID=1169152 RepID=UPI001E309564|nr:SAM-dependent methyltransferase [Nocardia sp. CNY236]
MFRTDTPNPARIWNYSVGGKDYYNRLAGDACGRIYPGITTLAMQTQQFRVRTERFLAEQGLRQFLDIGAGLPTAEDTHYIAQIIAPQCRVVYTSSDPQVLTHARALLTSTTGMVDVVDAGCRDPGSIIDQAWRMLDFSEPVGVLFMGVLGVDTVLGAVVSGSVLTAWDISSDSKDLNRMWEHHASEGAARYTPPSPRADPDAFRRPVVDRTRGDVGDRVAAPPGPTSASSSRSPPGAR